ncbi:hypothetical protein DNU06_03070 [Putridiphycobacter roseus]|uniref:PKD domain-containing protein n=1 Tax=Putridiphycobacter roseus TaxID=2219161 RepID=A0A2W1N3D1_9FLAO|nr:PKD domain-containing protein [Putridiphycobacter roseus]PZE18827.1 hypothetical protein DNU06_03070 [Putridiphycobacter roseus]
MIGSALVDEGGNTIVKGPTGDYFIGGYSGSSAMVTRITNTGTVVWSKTLNIGADPDYILQIDITTDNFIIGIGNSRTSASFNAYGFAFKMDLLGNVIWQKMYQCSNNYLWAPAIQEVGNGNYNIVGSYTDNRQDCYAMQLNNLTGAVVWDSIYANTSFGNAYDEHFADAIYYPGNKATYIAGRMQKSAGQMAYRPSLTKLDSNGVFQWTKMYLYNSATSSGRLYSYSIDLDGDSLIFSVYGKNGGTTTPFQVGLIKTDTAGNIGWSKLYSSTGGEDLRSFNLVNTPNGYIISGYTGSGNQGLFMIKTNKTGGLVWSKKYGDAGIEDVHLFNSNARVIIDNGFAVTVGRTNSFGNNFDLFIVKADLITGQLSNTNCYSDLTLSTISLPAYQEDFPMLTGRLPITATTPTINSSNVSLQNIGVLVENTNDTLISGDTIHLCLGENFIAKVLNATNSNFLWSTGSTSTTESFSSAGSFWVNVSGLNGCIIWSDTFHIVMDSLNLFLGNDTSFCESNPLILDATNTNANYLWQDGSTNPTFTVNQSGNYFVEVSNPTCTMYDTIIVTVDVLPDLDLGLDSTFCGNTVFMTLDAGPNLQNSTYLWQDNTTNSTQSVNQSGLYWVTHSNGTCEVSDSISISNVINSFELGNDTTLCFGENLVLTVGIQNGNILWSDNSSNQTLTVNTTGMVSVSVTEGACMVTDSIMITFIAPPIVNLGNDTTICEGNITLNANNTNFQPVWNDGSNNQTLNVTQTGTYYVTINNNGCVASDSIHVNIIQNTLPDIANTVLCENINYPIDISNANGNVVWNDGATSKVRTISTPGIYWVNLHDNGCIFTDTFNLNWQIILADGESSIQEGCAPLTVDFNNLSTVNFGSIDNWNWNLGDGEFANTPNPSHTYTSTGNHFQTITVTSNLGCTDTYQLSSSIEVFEKVDAYFTHSPNTTTIDKPIYFNNLTINPTYWSWNFGDGYTANEYNTDHTYTTPGLYTITLTVANDNGCEDQYVVSLIVENEILLYVPNIFTPNQTGTNSLWNIELIGGDVYNFHLQIFNRWGEIIWESFDQTVGWNGKYNGELVQDGAYIWRINYGDIASDKKHTHTGHVSVLK